MLLISVQLRGFLAMAALIILFNSCIRINQSAYKRVPIPSEFSTEIQKKILLDAVNQLKQPAIKTQILSSFPDMKEADILKTDIRWEVIQTSTSQTYFLVVGLKDTKGISTPDKMIEYLSSLAKQVISEAAERYKNLPSPSS